MGLGPSSGSPRAVPGRGCLRLRLWPQRYGVASVATIPVLASHAAGSSPVILVVGEGEITLVAPEILLDTMGLEVMKRNDGWRALTLAGEFNLDAVGVLAVLTRVLAEARVPVMAFSSFATDHLLVPDKQLGRALAALSQVSLPA